jgi:hypothetical protein
MLVGDQRMRSNPNQVLAQETRFQQFRIPVNCTQHYALITDIDFYFAVDLVSYDSNRKLLLELSSKKPINHQAIKELAILTFDGRRAKILSTEISVDEILTRMMPLLKDTTYVRN